MKKAYSFEEDLQNLKKDDFDVILVWGIKSNQNVMPVGAYLAYLDKASRFRPVLLLFACTVFLPFYSMLIRSRFVTPWKCWQLMMEEMCRIGFVLVLASTIEEVIEENKKSEDVIKSTLPSKYIVYEEVQNENMAKKVLAKVSIYNRLKDEESSLPMAGIFSKVPV